MNAKKKVTRESRVMERTGFVLSLTSGRVTHASRHFDVSGRGYAEFRAAAAEVALNARNYKLGKDRPIAYLIWEVDHHVDGSDLSYMRCSGGTARRLNTLYKALDQELATLKRPALGLADLAAAVFGIFSPSGGE